MNKDHPCLRHVGGGRHTDDHSPRQDETKTTMLVFIQSAVRAQRGERPLLPGKIQDRFMQETACEVVVESWAEYEKSDAEKAADSLGRQKGIEARWCLESSS